MQKHVVLIDDEIRAIQHMRRLLETQEALCTVDAHFLDARLALQSDVMMRADIVFADIMMPGMNGLCFCRELLSKRPGITIVLLTSYKDFAYAQEAMRLGIHHYWVKHEIRSATIQSKLRALLEKMRQATMISEKVENQVFLDALNGSVPFASISGKHVGAAYASLVYVRGIEVEDVSRLMNDADHCLYFGGVGIFMLHHAQPPHMPSLCHRLQYVLEDTVYGALASPVFKQTNYTPQLHRCMLSAVQNLALSRTVICADGTILETLSQNPVDLLEKEYLMPLETALSLWRTGDAMQLFEALWRHPTLLYGNLMALRFTHERLGALTKTYGMAGFDENGAITPDALAAHYRSELKKTLSQTEASMPILIKRVKAYVRGNLASDLQLKQLAREFNLSADHLRKTFKQDTGITLTEYITGERIRKAIQMIATGKYKIYEIADQVGFRSAQYFSQVFYRATGKYPTDYMN